MPEIDREDLLGSLRRMPGFVSAYQIDGDQMRVLYYSKKLIKSLGLRDDACESGSIRDAREAVYPGDLPRIREHVARCLRAKDDVYCELTIPRRRGGYAKTLCVSRIIGTFEGKPVMVSSFSDFALESEPYALPAISAADYRALVDNIPCGIAVLRMREGHISLLAANQALCAMVGVSQKGMNGDSAEELFRRVHPDDLNAARNAISVLFTKHHGAYCIYRTLNEKTHRYFWLHAFGRSVEQPDGSQIAYICYTDVTAQKTAEADLRRSRLRYQLAVKGANLTVWEYDIKTRRASCSDDGFARAGFPSAIEDAPFTLLDHVDERDRAQFLLMYADIENGKKTAGGEFWYRRTPSDKPRCARVTYSTIFDNRGRPVKAFGILQDITLQKLEAEKYVGVMQKMLKASAAALFTVCLDLTLNSVESGVGSGTASETGETADEFFARAAAQFVDAKAAASYRAEFSRRALLTAYFTGQSTHACLYLRRGDDGKNRWVEQIASLVQNPESGNLEAVISVFDRNEKVKGDRLIQRLTNEEYDFIGMIDISQRLFRVININTGEPCVLEQLASFTEEELLRRTVKRTIAPEDQERYAQSVALDNVAEHLQKDKTYTVSFTYIRQNGERRRKLLRYCWLDDTREEILVVRTDVTAAYRREREHLRLLQEALRSTEKANQMRNDCIANLSHDIRTPLNGISGFTNLALRTQSETERTEYLRKIEASTAQLARIVSDMLDFSMLESGDNQFQSRYFNVRSLLDDVSADVRSAAEKKCVWVEIDDSELRLQKIFADRVSLRKVLTTLLCNAISFSRPGGTVELRLESFAPVADGANCRISVSDHGAGIASEFLPYVFEPFAREDRAEDEETAGISLSLAVIKRLVEMMGGAIWVESEKGSGTVFTLLFRFAETAQPPAPVLSEDTAEFGLQGKKILVCEDNPLNLEITQTMLEQRGALVTCADNGETGVAAFAASQEDEFDAILMDIRMPRMDGLTAARLIRELDRGDARTIPIIAMTADVLDQHMDGLKASGVDAWLEKPFVPEELFELLAQRLHK